MNSESRLQKMPKRNLRVLKWLSATPVLRKIHQQPAKYGKGGGESGFGRSAKS